MNPRVLLIVVLLAAAALVAVLGHYRLWGFAQQEQDCRSRGGQPLFNERSQPPVLCLRKEALQ